MKRSLLVIVMAASLFGCGSDEKPITEPSYQQAQQQQAAPQPQVAGQPVIINQPAASGGGDSALTNMVLGGLVGHAIGSSGRQSEPQTRVVEKHYVSPQHRYSSYDAQRERAKLDQPKPRPTKSFRSSSTSKSFGGMGSRRR